MSNLPVTLTSSTAPNLSASHPTAQTSVSPFEPLISHPLLARLFAAYPSLPHTLSALHAATLPPSGDSPPRRGSRGSRAPWTPEKGTREGLYKLKALLDQDEGVQEFAALVGQLCGGDVAAEKEGDEMLRGLEGHGKAAKEEDVDTIRRLLEREMERG
ncbi:MAG: hypothetical protein M1819_002803 [Sarea resinae]|nr:MAG: hypothetical protein M1819_002803 [Sarea resinae]